MPDWESVLARAVQHVERGKALVAQQQERIDRLRTIGAATEDAERTLKLLLLTLATLESHKGISLRKRSAFQSGMNQLTSGCHEEALARP